MDKKEICLLLNSKNLKATQTRISLVNILSKASSAISYSSILKELKKIDRVTLYRTLQSLTENRIIHKAFQDNNDVYYAFSETSLNEKKHDHNHAHFKCVECNTISCEDLLQPIELQLSNFNLHKISVNIEGVCKVCQ